jgi:hypothetical protein
MSEYICRDCGTVVVVPASYMPEFKRRIVDIAMSESGESMWDRESKHLLVEDFDGYQSESHATCRVGKGHALAGKRLTLAMIQREIASV